MGMDKLDVLIAVSTSRLVDPLARLGRRGVAYRGPTAWGTGAVAEVADPDGIPVLLFEPSSHPRR
jgi:catechol 2,3-dioxygenase-like lactoylglutathione lyase family enzyme